MPPGRACAASHVSTYQGQPQKECKNVAVKPTTIERYAVPNPATALPRPHTRSDTSASPRLHSERHQSLGSLRALLLTLRICDDLGTIPDHLSDSSSWAGPKRCKKFAWRAKEAAPL